jgi:membrane glycosyltransferase
MQLNDIPPEVDALGQCIAYLDRLPMRPERRLDIAKTLQTQGAARDLLNEPADLMTLLHHLLAEAYLPADSATETTGGRNDPAALSIGERLRLHYLDGIASVRRIPAALLRRDGGAVTLTTRPPLNRATMAPDGSEGAATAPGSKRSWHRIATCRRLLLLALIVGQTWLATNVMVSVLPYHGSQPLEIPILVLFAILFGWISAGFWTALAGFLLLLRGSDSHAITRTLAGTERRIPAEVRTAVIMPICNEDVGRVFAGLRATYESLVRTGQLDRFDFFVLSDSFDADTRIAETSAWADLCNAVGGFGRVFYRWRKHRIKRKSGNVADFCRRWGRNYRYMVVLDADSMMTGDCLTTLVRLAEANPDAGIIQTAPRAAGRDTFHARLQQFATAVYGPLFTAGLHFWQLGESHYWGHNAIIRVAPFIRHCALARLPGRGALSGEILSHDFVEAALMRRAGWAVWIAYDLPGSYEEVPPNLIDELGRDRRWCQGNLMNFRLLLKKGLHPTHRAVFVTAVMAYLSAPLWFAFLLLSTALLAVHTLSAPQYFVSPYQLFPIWPEWHPEWAVSLFGATAFCLFVPKILAVLLAMQREPRAYGGRTGLAIAMLGEFALSSLLAPIRMLFHTWFVVAALFGVRTGWRSPPREDAQTSWGDAIRRHGLHTLIGVVWACFVAWLSPAYLCWMSPVIGALLFSIPISVCTSRPDFGRWLRRHRLFVTPEETIAPRVIEATRHYTRATPNPPGLDEAVRDPALNALTCATRARRNTVTAQMHERRENLFELALARGVKALSAAQRNRLIDDPVLLSRLHNAVWSAGPEHTAAATPQDRAA